VELEACGTTSGSGPLLADWLEAVARFCADMESNPTWIASQ